MSFLYPRPRNTFLAPFLLAMAVALLFLGLALVTPSDASVANCTSAHVTAGLCPSTSFVLLSFAVPNADTADLQAAISAVLNYTPSTNLCTAGRVEDRLCGGAGDPVQLGQVIPSNQVVSRWLRAVMIARVREYRASAAAETARQTSLSTADPAIP